MIAAICFYIKNWMVLHYELSLLEFFMEQRCITGGKGYPQCGWWYLSGGIPQMHIVSQYYLVSVCPYGVIWSTFGVEHFLLTILRAHALA